MLIHEKSFYNKSDLPLHYYRYKRFVLQ